MQSILTSNPGSNALIFPFLNMHLGGWDLVEFLWELASRYHHYGNHDK